MPQTAQRPNIVYVIVHDIGQHIGCYGAGVNTPNLDQLAADGVQFNNYHCTAAQCSPSRASIMTGRYPHENGEMGLAHIGWQFNFGEKTLPMYMNEAGYETHLFGHQHEHSDASKLGYQHLHSPQKSAAKQVTAELIDFLKEYAASPGEQPLHVCAGFGEPHRPYHREGYPKDDPATVQVQPWLPDRPGIREDIAGLNGLVWVVDEVVGQIRATLQETGLDQNTLFIFTTDHGTAMPRAKGTCYDPGTKTALIMHQPGVIEGGTVYDQLLSNCDFMPTLLDVAGGPEPADIWGRSFRRLLHGESYSPRDHIFSEMTWHDRYNPMRSVRTNRYKYIRNFGSRPLVYMPWDVYQGLAGQEMIGEYYTGGRPEHQLYDLENDPLEFEDVAGDPGYADVLEELQGMVQQWMEQTNDPLLLGDVPPTPAQAHRAATVWQSN
ncbi:MAG TPA: N-sulfoglucosamine sulfohydrolase [Armatimonadetes bacterium]|jgi:arylsulfatase A-like enzyme|nr:N-sulfoglucosamine sulfohydrolase [Armatimonadota bacterium]